MISGEHENECRRLEGSAETSTRLTWEELWAFRDFQTQPPNATLSEAPLKPILCL